MAMQLAELRGHKQYADRAFSALAIAAAGFVLLILGMIALVMTQRAWPVLGGQFFSSTRWSAADHVFGALPFLWGTLYTAAIAIALAVPVSLGIALFITQVSPPWLRKPMVYIVDLLAVVPSVVFGLWGVLVLADKIQSVYRAIHGIAAALQRFVGPVTLPGFKLALPGVSVNVLGFAVPIFGVIALAVMAGGVGFLLRERRALGGRALGAGWLLVAFSLGLPLVPVLVILGGGALLFQYRTQAGWATIAVGAVLLLFSVGAPPLVFGESPQGRSFATAGVILAIMIIPIITSLAREVIETTPATEKEAALALGATRWEMISASVLPHSKGGLVGAVMLGLGRAMGETIAAALVIGSSLGQTTVNAFASGNSMPAVIANEWGEAETMHKSALIALAVTLFVITVAVNLIASWIVRRSMARTAGKRT
jgi:ABC-type phosphate transport system permease subunit